jgi:hypothetical protein
VQQVSSNGSRGNLNGLRFQVARSLYESADDCGALRAVPAVLTASSSSSARQVPMSSSSLRRSGLLKEISGFAGSESRPKPIFRRAASLRVIAVHVAPDCSAGQTASILRMSLG